MTFDEMMAQYQAYEQDEKKVAEYSDILARMIESSGEGADGFHERTITRLAAVSDAVKAAPTEQVDAASTAETETEAQ